MKIETYIDFDGGELQLRIYGENKFYRNAMGLLHRLDGPAIEYSDGSHLWYKDGGYHRIGGNVFFTNKKHHGWYINGHLVNIYYICG